MDRNHAVSGVVLFAGSLLAVTADEQSADPDWLTGVSGRRLAVAFTDVIDLHRPDSAGRCPDCRLSPGPSLRTCRTWDLIVRALVGADDAWLDREHRRLRIRYLSESP